MNLLNNIVQNYQQNYLKNGSQKLFRIECTFFLPSTICLHIETTIEISEAMTVRVWKKRIELEYHELKWILPRSLELSKWSDLERMLRRYESDFQYSSNDEDIYLKNINEAIKCLTTIKERQLGNVTHISILLNQLELSLSKHKRRWYDVTSALLSFCVFNQSPATYSSLRNHLILQTKRYWLEICSFMKVSPNEKKDLYYFKLMQEECTHLERHVVPKFMSKEK